MMARRNFTKEARAFLGLSVTEFAAALGITRQTVWRYESGDPVPNTTRLAIEGLLIAHENKPKRQRVRKSK